MWREWAHTWEEEAAGTAAGAQAGHTLTSPRPPHRQTSHPCGHGHALLLERARALGRRQPNWDYVSGF